MRNKYAGTYLVCKKPVPAGAGYFQRMNGGWVCRCTNCVGKGNEPQKEASHDR